MDRESMNAFQLTSVLRATVPVYLVASPYSVKLGQVGHDGEMLDVTERPYSVGGHAGTFPELKAT